MRAPKNQGRCHEIMKHSIEQKVRASFALTFVFLLLTGVAAGWTAVSFVKDSQWVKHTDLVLDKLQETLLALVDVEDGACGYVFMGHERFLRTFIRRGIQQCWHAEKALRASEEYNRSIVESGEDCHKVLSLEVWLLGVSRDITGSKSAEEAVQQRNMTLKAQATELESANQGLESFAYTVSTKT